MALPLYALQYSQYPKDELRKFVMQRQNLSGREYKKKSKKDLVKRLLRLDQTATFRLFDLPPEIRERCFQNAVARVGDFRRLLLVSKQVHCEVRLLFYKEATFDIAFAHPDCPTRTSGDPVFRMCTRYWNRVNCHPNPFRMSLAKTFYLQHHMFRNIRQLSLKGEMLEDVTRHGAAVRRFRVGGSRLLFLTCVFYAFNDMPTQLKTLRYYVEDHKPPHMVTVNEMLSTLWPLKLLEGRVQVEIHATSEELVGRMSLREMVNLDFPVIEACVRFACCYFSHHRPSIGKSDSLEATRAFIYSEKLAGLAAFKIPIFMQDIWRLRNFVKRMEWMEAEYLDHAENERSWGLTRAWVRVNGSPPQL
jgi:hypothetical protein